MKNSNKLKEIVRDKYADIATESSNCCCGNKNKQLDYSVFNESYADKEGYFKDADLNLGCGLPTEYSNIKKGDAVLDIGSGAGNDCFVARSIVGENGKVTGLDFTDEMLEKAKINNQKAGYTNVNFIKGDIENIPLDSDKFDVVISNCVLNLVPDKEKAFSEIKRVLKPNAHFCVSDIVLEGELPKEIRDVAEMYAGCVSGALQEEKYLSVIESAGFNNIEVKKKKQINVPDDQLLEYISKDELQKYKDTGAGIYSITVIGTKR